MLEGERRFALGITSGEKIGGAHCYYTGEVLWTEEDESDPKIMKAVRGKIRLLCERMAYEATGERFPMELWGSGNAYLPDASQQVKSPKKP